MSISAAIGISVSGMQAQTTRLSATANNIANATTPGYARQTTNLSSVATGGVSATVTSSGDQGVDMLTEVTDMLGAKQAFAANAAAFETGADMWQVLMTIKRD
ncbi:flagellar basal body protein [Neorhizobium alkalisoli]|uniref:Flagellar basal-body rod protein FlgC n=1 Tax=Neorhizobium alkalisoli TaxID=528178 RepID=A0A561QV12_9HYPH|nr:flagellar basal body protein [Neorhizobium alkalisoli]TWF54213.1 flagellar basal-body rod protein FlgC [Neorhizobium alkalisoli]